MILIEATIKYAGYDPDDLKSKSSKRICCVCDGCDRVRWLPKSAYRDLCRSCASKNKWADSDYKQKRTLQYQSSEFKESQSIKMLQYHVDNPEFKIQLSKIQLKLYQNPEKRKKMSCAQKKRFEDPNEHEKLSRGQKKRFRENPVSDEVRKKQSEIQKKVRENDPTIAKRISATMQHISYNEWENFVCESPYCPAFNDECRKSNREKYGNKCFLSNLPEEKNITKTGKQRKLSVHHVDMDKGQGCDGKRWKLIPVCMKWHAMIHTKLWEARIIWLLNNVW